MTELFYAVLKASFQGSIVILAVLLLRLLLKKAPKSVFCLLWLLAGLRLVLPFEIESRLSLQPDYTPEPRAVDSSDILDSIPDYQGDILIDIPDDFQAAPEQQGKPEVDWEKLPTVTYPTTQPVGEKRTFEDIAAPIWLLGMGFMVAASAFSYIRLKRRVRMAYLIENGCFECPGLETAFVLGFLPPKVYLPAGLTDGEKKFIYDHENTHIARSDHWFKLLGWLVLSLHWFNPLVWVGYSMLCRDIELACDEHVVRNMSLAQRKAYSAALLSCGGHTARIAACPVAFGESNPKRRIMNVLNYKKPTFWISLLAVAAVIFVSVCLLTSPGNPSLLEFGNVVDEALHDIGIGSKNALVAVSHPDDIREIQKLLDSISWEKDTSTERPDESGGYVILFNSLLAEDALYFSEDCSLVWAENTNAYPVSDSGKLLEYLDSLTEAVLDRETSGTPFANISQPAQWLRGISENAVREAQIYVERPTVYEGNTSSTTRSMGVLSARNLNALLDILNGLPESAIVSESTLRRETFGALVGSLTPHGGMTLTVWDDVNQLVMVLRLVKNDVMEFILIDELDKVEDRGTYLDHPKCWIIEDDTLLTFLKEMQAYPTIIMQTVSHEEHLAIDTSGSDETKPAWTMDMTDEEFLAMCRDAVEEFQKQEYYHISETYVYYINDKEDARDYCTYWRAGDNWLRDSQATKLRENTDAFYFEGNLYLRRNAEAGWTKVDGGAGYNRVWLEMLDWDAQEIKFTFAEPVEDVLHVFVTVQATPPTIGWDDVDEYMLGFFFDTDGNLLSAMMGCTREEINVMSDLRMNSTTAQSIRTKLEQEGEQCHGESATCTDPDCINPAHQHNMDELAAEYEAKLQLAKCAEALRKCQEQGYWEITENRIFPGGGLVNDTSSCVWYISGNSLLSQNAIPETGGYAEIWQMCHESNSYHRQGFVTNGPEFGGSYETEWNKGLYDSASMVLTPWPLRFEMDGAKLSYISTVQEENGVTITFSIFGDPLLQNGEKQNYTVSFMLDDAGNLKMVQMRYQLMNVYPLEHDIVFQGTSREDVEKQIHRCYSEALLHTEGICNDPDCTDSTHHHDDHHH